MSRDRDCGVAFYSGGNWNNGANAGLFALNGNNPRSNSNWNLGFRSALPSDARIGNSKDYRQCEGIKEPVSTPAEKQEKNGAMLMAFCRCGIGCGGCQYL